MTDIHSPAAASKASATHLHEVGEGAPDTSGMRLRRGGAWLHDVVELLSSMRFAIALLTVIAIASVIGTVLKQNEPYPNYVNQFGPFWADIFHGLSLYAVYGSWWFLLILAFLVISTSLCIIRNAPKMLVDMRTWKDHVREGSLRAFHHKTEFSSEKPRAQLLEQLGRLIQSHGYRFRLKQVEPTVIQEGGEGRGTTLIAARRGASNKLGYILAHSAIVIICLGALLDGDLLVRLQLWFGGKTPLTLTAQSIMIRDIPERHRLDSGNPSFRGNVYVPEGATAGAALLSASDGTLVQELPFSIQLKKFTVDYYSTGMPKLFSSDVIITDRKTGQQTEGRIEVNKPLMTHGVAIYQSSFEDGGSSLTLKGYPMRGELATPFTLTGEVNSSVALAGSEGDTVEFSGFRMINVENITDGSGRADARGVAKSSLNETLTQHLGSGANLEKDKLLRNVGPSIQYKIRDKSGQAREYSNYMQALLLDGQWVFLAGVRDSPSEPFRYLRIPADENQSIQGWMQLRAALQNPALRAEAAKRFANRSFSHTGADAQTNAPNLLRQQLQESAHRALDLFAGVALPNMPALPKGTGGFQAVAEFLGKTVPAAEQEKAADVLLKILNAGLWELWQITREQNGLPPAETTEAAGRYLQLATNALSDSFFYVAPVYLQLTDFKQRQASVFQVTRSPGKNIVYLGCLLLVAGIFSMFYIRERRMWIWLKDRQTVEGQPAGAQVLMAMSTTRKTLDFDKEFQQLAAAMQAQHATGTEVIARSIA